MAENLHYKELLRLLNQVEARYLIVGGYAIMKYTEPRYTKDLDIWVENSAKIPSECSKRSANLGHLFNLTA
jgi:hypothetical protein